MNKFRAVKVISSVPTQVDPDTLYFVRVGNGFDLYCSDTTGSIAYKLNEANAFNVLDKLLLVDGTGSNLDADLLDGYDSIDFAKVTSNKELITQQKNLLFQDAKYQYLSCTSPQIVNLPNPSSSLNKEFVISNVGNNSIELYENNITTEVIINPKGVVECHSDGQDWNIFIQY